MSWTVLKVAPSGTHHTNTDGSPAYPQRFDEVLKFHAPGRAPVRRADEAWHILPDGSAAYSRRFQKTFGYYEGWAAVMGKHGWHHITIEGRDAYAHRYAWCGNFQGERCAVREAGGAYLHILGDGRPAYTQRWSYAGDYRDQVAVVQSPDGLSTHIDQDGQIVHGRWFVDLDVFHKQFARARDENGWTHVDRTGRPIYERRFAAVEPFYNGQARVERFDGAIEIVDESGRTVVGVRRPQSSQFAGHGPASKPARGA